MIKRLLLDIWSQLSVYIIIILTSIIVYIANIFIPEYTWGIAVVSIIILLYIFLKYLIK